MQFIKEVKDCRGVDITNSMHLRCCNLVLNFIEEGFKHYASLCFKLHPLCTNKLCIRQKPVGWIRITVEVDIKIKNHLTIQDSNLLAKILQIPHSLIGLLAKFTCVAGLKAKTSSQVLQ